MSTPTPAVTPRRRGADRMRLLLLAISTTLMLGLTECALRLALPSTAFRDLDSNDFWILRLRATLLDQEHHAQETVYDDHLGWRARPGFARDNTHQNSRGVRSSVEHAALKSPGTQRIVTIGDSFTWGLGVGDEETYAARLEALLPATEVINLGVNGYGTDQQVLLWEEQGTGYQPDLVILGFFVHNFHRNGQMIFGYPKPYFVADPQATDGFRLSGVPVPAIEKIFDDELFPVASSSRIVDAGRFGWEKLVRRLGWFDPAQVHHSEVAITRFLLERLDRSTHAAGARLVVVVIPPTAGTVRDAAFIAKTVVEACEQLAIPVHDLTAMFDDLEASGESLYTGTHWNARGHQLAASELVRYLRSAGFVADPGDPNDAPAK